MTKLLKVSLIALALAGTSAHADTDYFANEADQAVSEDNFSSEDGLSIMDPSAAYRPGRPDRPGRPGWRPGRPDHGRRIHRCVARDFRGRSYLARGFGNVNRVAREALRSCRYNSRIPQTCRVVSCR